MVKIKRGIKLSKKQRESEKKERTAEEGIKSGQKQRK
jgi:hypothetical protein